MFSFVYNIFLGLYFFLNFFRIFQKKNSHFLQRIFYKKKEFQIKKNKKIIWIHAVSVGEVKAIKRLAYKLKNLDDNIFLLISTITETGYKEAKKSIFFADRYIYLPFDFSWIVKRVINLVKPNLVILSETDFWYNFLRISKQYAKIVLVNGKISDNSFYWYKKFSFFSKKMFSLIDLFCLQNNKYKEKFEKLKINKEKLKVTDNLKISNIEKRMSLENIENYKKLFKIEKDEKVITIASTHKKEEDLLLRNIDLKYKIFLVPRHPERFNEVENIFKKNNISYCTFSNINNLKKEDKIILIDKMGFLNICYQISDLAIVGGSFIKKIGGHNILEPIFFGKTVFFGPYMEKQEDLKNIVIDNGYGKEVKIENLNEEILSFFEKNKNLQKKIDINRLEIPLKNTFQILENFI